MKLDRENLKLYAITDRSWLKKNETIYDIVEKALEGGITMLQVREKTLDRDLFLKEINNIKPICHRYGVPLIVNDSLSLALESKADGIHIGQNDINSSINNMNIPKSMILGVSANSINQALIAEKNNANYLGVGAIFPTSTKIDANNLNIKILKSIAKSVTIPTVAIGGITKENISLLTNTSIAGISLISAIFNNSDIKQATIDIKNIIERTKF